jgi:hypothetical protein
MSFASIKGLLTDMAKGLVGPGELGGPWVVMVADSDGIVLSAWESQDNKVSPETFGGFIQIINYANNAMKSTSVVGFTKIDDITVATPFTYMIVKPIAGGACFIFVSSPKSVPLGMIRIALANYAPRLELALPGNEAIFQKDDNGAGTVAPPHNGAGTVSPNIQPQSQIQTD